MTPRDKEWGSSLLSPLSFHPSRASRKNSPALVQSRTVWVTRVGRKDFGSFLGRLHSAPWTRSRVNLLVRPWYFMIFYHNWAKRSGFWGLHGAKRRGGQKWRKNLPPSPRDSSDPWLTLDLGLSLSENVPPRNSKIHIRYIGISYCWY